MSATAQGSLTTALESEGLLLEDDEDEEEEKKEILFDREN